MILLITGVLLIPPCHHQMTFRQRCEWRPRDEGRVSPFPRDKTMQTCLPELVRNSCSSTQRPPYYSLWQRGLHRTVNRKHCPCCKTHGRNGDEKAQSLPRYAIAYIATDLIGTALRYIATSKQTRVVRRVHRSLSYVFGW